MNDTPHIFKKDKQTMNKELSAPEITFAASEPTQMREFDTGATRHSEDSKIDYEGFFSPLVFRRYGEYMHGHRTQADGKPRASDNWQKGMPLSVYMKSLWRHFMEAWALHRVSNAAPPTSSSLGCDEIDIALEDALCGVIFNASGYLHELLKEE